MALRAMFFSSWMGRRLLGLGLGSGMQRGATLRHTKNKARHEKNENAIKKMVHSLEIHDDDFEVTTRSVGCGSALLPQRLRVMWCSRLYRTNSSSQAADDSAGPPPSCLKAESSGAPNKDKGEMVKTPTVEAQEAWTEMKRRFQVAHRFHATRASSDGVLFAPARRNPSADASHSANSSNGKELAPWELYLSSLH
ncbi:hypothetical protein T484DRAFT_2027502 [Baffinella frigidus]|nr:hypothetical protein T484DRAFT_2027502 [Cryptophyta sp. CCMP2293]